MVCELCTDGKWVYTRRTRGGLLRGGSRTRSVHRLIFGCIFLQQQFDDKIVLQVGLDVISLGGVMSVRPC